MWHLSNNPYNGGESALKFKQLQALVTSNLQAVVTANKFKQLQALVTSHLQAVVTANKFKQLQALVRYCTELMKLPQALGATQLQATSKYSNINWNPLCTLLLLLLLLI